MNGDAENYYDEPDEIITPENFFPSEPLNAAFRLFCFQYCCRLRRIGVRFDAGKRPLLELAVLVSHQVERLVTVRLYSAADRVMVKAITPLDGRNPPGLLQMVLMFTDDRKSMRYHVELNSDFIAQFYGEAATASLRLPRDFYELIIHLAEVAVRLEQSA